MGKRKFGATCKSSSQGLAKKTRRNASSSSQVYTYCLCVQDAGHPTSAEGCQEFEELSQQGAPPSLNPAGGRHCSWTEFEHLALSG